MNIPKSVQAAWLVVVFITGGCATTDPLISRLDERGMTWVSLDQTMTLARAVPRFSRAARDYVYIAPVQTNEAGELRHYLWLGFASTVDRAREWVQPASATTVLLVLDGLQLALPLSNWDSEFGKAVYQPPIDVERARLARLTRAQVQRIANADSVSVEFLTDAGDALAYEVWQGAWSTWEVL